MTRHRYHFVPFRSPHAHPEWIGSVTVMFDPPVPVSGGRKLMQFGAKDEAEAMRMIMDLAQEHGVDLAPRVAYRFTVSGQDDPIDAVRVRDLIEVLYVLWPDQDPEVVQRGAVLAWRNGTWEGDGVSLSRDITGT